MKIPPAVHAFARIFKDNGFQCFLVGGATRDLLMGRVHADWDIATDARPARVMEMFRRVIPTGLKHGTVTVFFGGTRFEVTTFRIESGYSDGRRPDSVVFAPTIFEDLSRRDFTMNAIAYDLHTDKLHDPHRGRADLSAGIIRAIGNPEERFREDGLRPLRACRFAAQFSFAVEPATREAIGKCLETAAGVSLERVRDEILKILAAPVPSVGFALMKDTGLLSLFLPELAACAGVAQGDFHCFDVLVHSLYACDAAPRDNHIVRLAALLHDVGKPPCRVETPSGRPTFYDHERAGARMTEDILTRLRLPNAVIKRTAHLVLHHMFNYTEEWSDSAVRRLISRVGEEYMDDLIELRRADQIGMCNRAGGVPQGLVDFISRLRSVMAKERAFTVKQLDVSGADIMERLSIPPGPAVGIILSELLSAVLDDPSQNERETLLEIAERLFGQRISPGGVSPEDR